MKLIITVLAALAIVVPAGAEGEMTGTQIQAEFKKMGNTKTRILVTHDRIYKPLDMKAYLDQIVMPLTKDLIETGNDSTNLKLDDGTEIRMLPVAAGWFELKAPKRSPESNAALAYFRIQGTPGAGFVIRSLTGYPFVSASTTSKVKVSRGSVGVSFGDTFIPFDRMEFDLPKDFEIE
jgi:hypothetical protein